MLFLFYLILTCTCYAGSTCDVEVDTMNFADYDPDSNIPLDITATLRVLCRGIAPVNYTVSIDKGTGIGASITSGRLMTGTASQEQLIYNLFTDDTRLTILGDAVEGQEVAGTTESHEGDHNHHPSHNHNQNQYTSHSYEEKTIYGRIFPNQDKPADTYQDITIITITYS